MFYTSWGIEWDGESSPQKNHSSTAVGQGGIWKDWFSVLFSENAGQKWLVPTILLSFQAQNCVYGGAWDGFQAVWLIKHLQKIRVKCRTVLFKRKPIGTRRKQLYKPPITGVKLKQVCSMLWAPFTFEVLTSISSLFSCYTSAFGGLLAWIPPVYVLWQEPGTCYTEPVHPFCFSSSLEPPASCLGDLIAFKCLETCVAGLRGSVGRADAEGKWAHHSLHNEMLVGLKRGEPGTGKGLVQSECDCPHQTLEYL